MRPAVISTNSTVFIDAIGLTDTTEVLLGGVAAAAIVRLDEDTLRVSGFKGTPGTVAVELRDGTRVSSPYEIELQEARTLRPVISGALLGAQWLLADPAATNGAVLVLDSAAGIFSLTPQGELTMLEALGAGLDRPVAGAFGPDGRLHVIDADGPRLVRRENGDPATWTVLLDPLPSLPTGITIDMDGNVYWCDGTTTVYRLSATGVLDPDFATVPGGWGITSLLGRLYISDPEADSIHRVQISTAGVEPGWLTTIDGVYGLTADESFVYSRGPAGVLRISPAGSTFAIAGAPPDLGGAVTHTLAMTVAAEGLQPAPWAIQADGSVLGSGWKVVAVNSERSRANAAVWVGERLYISYGQCSPTARGAIVEFVEGAFSRVAYIDVCTDDTLSGSPAGWLIWFDQHDSGGISIEVKNPVTGSALGGLGGSGLIGTEAVAITSLTHYLVGSAEHVEYWSSAGLLDSDLVGSLPTPLRGLAVAGSGLHIALENRILRLVLDPIDGSPGDLSTVMGTDAGFTHIGRLASFENQVFFSQSSDVFALDEFGAAITIGSAEGDLVGLAPSPYGDFVIISPDNPPRALLP